MRKPISKLASVLAMTLGIGVIGGSVVGGIALAADSGPDLNPAVRESSQPASNDADDNESDDRTIDDDSAESDLDDDHGDDDGSDDEGSDDDVTLGTDDDEDGHLDDD